MFTRSPHCLRLADDAFFFKTGRRNNLLPGQVVASRHLPSTTPPRLQVGQAGRAHAQQGHVRPLSRSQREIWPLLRVRRQRQPLRECLVRHLPSVLLPLARQQSENWKLREHARHLPRRRRTDMVRLEHASRLHAAISPPSLCSGMPTIRTVAIKYAARLPTETR